jgi:hypothetical protein
MQFEHFLREPPSGPRLLGLPRFYWRKPVDHLLGYARSKMGGRRSAAFFHELQLIRFTALLYRAARHRLGTSMFGRLTSRSSLPAS